MILSQLEILKKLHLSQVLHVMRSVHFSGHSSSSYFIYDSTIACGRKHVLLW